jgi:hypothetical protein
MPQGNLKFKSKSFENVKGTNPPYPTQKTGKIRSVRAGTPATFAITRSPNKLLYAKRNNYYFDL